MLKRGLIILISSFYLFISCKENVTETEKVDEPPSLSDVKILHPNGGETLIVAKQDTIKWSHPDAIKSMGIYYTLDGGKNWKALANNVQIPSGKFVWEIPDNSTDYAKIKIKAYSQDDEYIIESDSVFSIVKPIQILEPLPNAVYTDPASIKISWNCLTPYDRLEIYYSKYSETIIHYGNPDNKIVYSSKWILLNENIDGALREYIWDNPYLYSNKVQIKVIGFNGNDSYEVVSDEVFTVYCDEILFEERQYQEKLSVGNKWVYKITEEYYSDYSETYYLVKEAVSQFMQDGKKFYEIREKLIRDSVSYSFADVRDREHYSPGQILQDGDKFIKENYSGENGNWGLYNYHSNSCKVYEEEVFSENLLIKEYNFYVSGDGIYSVKTKRAKDFGTYYKKSNSEGFFRTTILQGAFIDGVLYGDTIIVR